jgi:hypothetical protein
MKKVWKQILSVILVVVLMIGYIPMQSTALEPVRIPEDDVVEETAQSGAFYLAFSSAKLSEESPVPSNKKNRKAEESILSVFSVS